MSDLEIDDIDTHIQRLQGMPAKTRVSASFNMTPKQWVSLLRASKRATAATVTFVRQYAVSSEIADDNFDEVIT